MIVLYSLLLSNRWSNLNERNDQCLLIVHSHWKNFNSSLNKNSVSGAAAEEAAENAWSSTKWWAEGADNPMGKTTTESPIKTASESGETRGTLDVVPAVRRHQGDIKRHWLDIKPKAEPDITWYLKVCGPTLLLAIGPIKRRRATLVWTLGACQSRRWNKIGRQHRDASLHGWGNPFFSLQKK